MANNYLYFSNPNSGAPDAAAELGKVVMDELVRIINSTNNPFQVVSDKENSIFNITGVTACSIVTADTP